MPTEPLKRHQTKGAGLPNLLRDGRSAGGSRCVGPGRQQEWVAGHVWPAAHLDASAYALEEGRKGRNATGAQAWAAGTKAGVAPRS